MLVGLAVYQQQIGLDVAFPVVCPIARKAMVFILGRLKSFDSVDALMADLNADD